MKLNNYHLCMVYILLYHVKCLFIQPFHQEPKNPLKYCTAELDLFTKMLRDSRSLESPPCKNVYPSRIRCKQNSNCYFSWNVFKISAGLALINLNA